MASSHIYLLNCVCWVLQNVGNIISNTRSSSRCRELLARIAYLDIRDIVLIGLVVSHSCCMERIVCSIPSCIQFPTENTARYAFLIDGQAWKTHHAAIPCDGCGGMACQIAKSNQAVCACIACQMQEDFADLQTMGAFVFAGQNFPSRGSVIPRLMRQISSDFQNQAPRGPVRIRARERPARLAGANIIIICVWS